MKHTERKSNEIREKKGKYFLLHNSSFLFVIQSNAIPFSSYEYFSISTKLNKMEKRKRYTMNST